MIGPTEQLDPQRYAVMTAAPLQLVSDILYATHDAYVSAVNSPGGKDSEQTYDGVKSSPHCLFVATHISDYLDRLGKDYQTGTQSVYFPDSNGKSIFHLVATVEAPELTTDLIVVDAAYQQFLLRRSRSKRFIKDHLKRTEHPELLIGTPTEVAKIALGIGFSKDQAATWNPSQ